MAEGIQQSDVYLFADDTKVFKGILEEGDCNILQHDLNSMYEWTANSLLKFHPDKCVFMRIGNSNIDKFNYTLNGHQLRESTEEKDIGVIIDSKLSFDKHISTKINKANRIMGLIRHTMEYLDKENFLMLYKSLVRPHLEYANPVWSPYLKKHITAIENVQRRATKRIPGFKNKPYEERLKELNLPTLAYRRYRGDMIELFKIIKGFYDENVTEGMIPMYESKTRGRTEKIF